MKEWIERNAWNVLAIAAPVMMAVLILISEIKDINSEIKYVKEQSREEIKYVKEQSDRKIEYVKEQSERKIAYLQERIEDYRKEYNQKWVETNKMLIDLHRDMRKEEK